MIDLLLAIGVIVTAGAAVLGERAAKRRYGPTDASREAAWFTPPLIIVAALLCIASGIRHDSRFTVAMGVAILVMMILVEASRQLHVWLTEKEDHHG